MSKRKRKNKGKRKKGLSEIIRTDVWDLATKPEEKQQLIMTIEEYRRFLKPLVLIINAQWIELAELSAKERVAAVEKIIHKTTDNPEPKHNYYQKVIYKYPSFRKFPSYLRRAAIADALGIVSSFQTRYREWQSGIRSRRDAKPPVLTAMCNSYPSLYKGQQVRYGLNYSSVDIKVWNGKDWVWINKIPVKGCGDNRHLVVGNEMQSPALVVNKKTCQLSMPVKILKVNKEDSDDVLGVDLGINNAATCSIVGRDGTVKGRLFINPARDIDRRNQRRMMIAHKSKQTKARIGKDKKLPKGFCKGLYRKSSKINLEIARKISKRIIDFANLHKVKVIVIENLEGWKAKAGRKKSLTKQKFHLWCHRKIVETLTQRWTELGGIVQTINPKYTSAYAYDGSGKVKRNKNNYSLARFTTGKIYQADLSASYNIAARYWYCSLIGDKTFSRVFEDRSSTNKSRTPITLGTLWNLSVS
ncbi:transposase [Scytonema hofmannii PCC 7110]|uniref:Transposase n=1 Tax=Scytonema hofmannii PCC 7110 TaxID=128403 RepID=A0A139X9J3_9CYAN|nr:IS200/IS605 family accessory protein TnpB-related protein [Scytonema hofmannii]KYC41367.1 transposase [Scytonema hofmannii PCC 7110]